MKLIETDYKTMAHLNVISYIHMLSDLTSVLMKEKKALPILNLHNMCPISIKYTIAY